MGRHPKRRVISYLPQLGLFVPQAGSTPPPGEPPVVLGLDELEALRLAHLEGLEHTLAGRALGISRPTFGRILQRAHAKVTRALIEGRPLLVEGGAVTLDECPLRCLQCERVVPADQLTDLATRACPRCGGKTRALRDDEIDRLTGPQLALLGERLDLKGKRAYLRTAVRLSADADTASPLSTAGHSATNSSSRLPRRVDRT